MSEKEPTTHYINIGPEGVAFFKAIHAITSDPRLRAQDLLVMLDEEITAINEQGIPTADITGVLDMLWEHLADQNWTLPIDQEHLAVLRGEREDPKEPQEGDYVIQPDGTISEHDIKFWGHPSRTLYGDDGEETMRFIRFLMKRSGIFSDVWTLSDHGNLYLYRAEDYPEWWNDDLKEELQ